MTTNTDQSAININSRATIISAVYLGIIGPAVFIIQPGFVQGMVEYLKFSEQQAGYIASSEMWGIAITTLILSFVSDKVNWRKVLILSTLLMVIANLLSTTTTDPTIFAIYRSITGIGAGTLISLTFTIIGLTDNPDRNFGYMIMWILVYGALGFIVMPYTYSAFGFNAMLFFFALFSLSGLPFIRYLPISSHQHLSTNENTLTTPAFFKVMAVSCMFLYFVAQGVSWAYLFLIGTNSGIAEQEVANALTLSQFSGIAGALLAAVVGNRFGRIAPLSIGIIGSVVSLIFLFGKVETSTYFFAVCLFNFVWNMTHPFLLASMANFDQTGRVVIHAVTAQMFGIALGPAIAANLIAPNDYSSVLWVGILLFIVSLTLITPPLIKQGQQRQSSTSSL